MTSLQFDDIKYLIESSALRTEQSLTEKIEILRNEMHAGFAGIAEVIDRHNDELDNHDKRITKLEASAAK